MGFLSRSAILGLVRFTITPAMRLSGRNSRNPFTRAARERPAPLPFTTSTAGVSVMEAMW